MGHAVLVRPPRRQRMAMQKTRQWHTQAVQIARSRDSQHVQIARGTVFDHAHVGKDRRRKHETHRRRCAGLAQDAHLNLARAIKEASECHDARAQDRHTACGRMRGMRCEVRRVGGRHRRLRSRCAWDCIGSRLGCTGIQHIERHGRDAVRQEHQGRRRRCLQAAIVVRLRAT